MCLIQCKYCDEIGVFSDECTCSNQDARDKIDKLTKENHKLDNKLHKIWDYCYQMISKYVNIEIIKNIVNLQYEDDNFDKWYDEHYRDIMIIADVSELFSKKRCKSIYVKGAKSHRKYSSRELFTDILKNLNWNRSESEAKNWPYMTVDELIHQIKEENV